jgi:hypothetical protein
VTTSQDKVRAEVLVSGLYDIVPLAEIDSVIIDNHLAETISAKQDLALATIQSLVEDGLMEFVGWDIPLDAAMARVHDRYVDNYDDRGAWAVSVWLDLTDAGKRVARELEGKAAR